MTDLASLGIVVKTTGVKEATRELDNLTKEGAAAEKQAARVSEGWRKAGKTIGIGIAAGVGVATLALKKYFTNTIEAERVQAQLEARIKSTGMAARLSLGDLNKMAQALQFKTSFDDESIGEVQALLLTFTKIGRETFPDATEAVLNLSTAMGTDLNSAALQVGKALNDPVQGVTALARAGVQFSKSQKAVIKDLVETGRQAEAQAIILKELETQMGGAAVAARNTLGGALKALENSFDNLLEGDSGSSGVKGTRDAIEAFNRTLNDPGIKRGVDTIVAGLLNIANTAIQTISMLAGVRRAVADAFAADADKSYEGLLQKRLKLSEALYKTENNTTTRIGARLGLNDGGKKQREELAALDAYILARQKADKLERNRALGVNIIDGSAPPKGVVEAPEPKESKAAGRARAVREMPDFSKDAAEDLRRLVEETAQADEAFASLAATLQGPLAAAQYEYERNLEEITELGTKAGRSSQEIAEAKRLETQRYEEERLEIEKSLDVVGQLLEAKQFELDLIGLSNVERQTAIDLQRLGRAATEEEAAAIRDLNQAYESTNQTIGLMDDFRGSLANGLADAALDFRNAGDIIKDTIDDIAARLTQWIADQLIAKAFGSQGSTGSTSSGGGLLSGLLGAFTGGGDSGMGSIFDLFKGGWASGGYTGPGGKNKPAGIVHAGEYVINADATRNLPRSYLDHLNSGGAPAMKSGTSSVVVNQSFSAPGRIDRKTAAQMQQDAQFKLSRAAGRNR